MRHERDGDRLELAAQFVRLSRVMIAAESPFLAANGIEMWDYIILNALSGLDTTLGTGAPTQLELARITGRDKTRLITNLDRLEQTGLVRRRPDPADRRARIVEITVPGTTVVSTTRQAIRRMEDDLLAEFAPNDRETFLRVLARLSSGPHRLAKGT